MKTPQVFIYAIIIITLVLVALNILDIRLSILYNYPDPVILPQCISDRF